MFFLAFMSVAVAERTFFRFPPVSFISFSSSSDLPIDAPSRIFFFHFIASKSTSALSFSRRRNSTQICDSSKVAKCTKPKVTVVTDLWSHQPVINTTVVEVISPLDKNAHRFVLYVVFPNLILLLHCSTLISAYHYSRDFPPIVHRLQTNRSSSAGAAPLFFY